LLLSLTLCGYTHTIATLHKAQYTPVKLVLSYKKKRKIKKVVNCDG